MSQLIERFFSLPISVWFNFRYLPFHQAIRLPFAIHYNTACYIVGGIKLDVDSIHMFMIRVGFHRVPVVPENKTVLDVKGSLVFKGTAHIGRGARIVVHKNAEVELGDNFAISASSYINCYKRIKMGRDIQLAWGDLLMDSDTHVIIGEDGTVINESKEIVLGDKIWIGCDSKVLKGAVIPNNSVVGANSVVTAGLLEPNSLIVGSPAKSVKRIKGFRI